MVKKYISLFLVFCLFVLGSACPEDNEMITLTDEIVQAKDIPVLLNLFQQLANLYFKDNQYSQFIDFLKSLSRKRKDLAPFINYFTALARYNQLKYLEENQLWNEYFNQGSLYRNELVKAAQETINITETIHPLHIYARLILWQFHKDNDGAFTELSLENLMDSVLEYSKTAVELYPIKVIADRLYEYKEKSACRKLYKIYTDKIIASGIEDKKLADFAREFYKEGNLELAEQFFDIYLERIKNTLKEDKFVSELFEIARLFSYKDEGLNDPLYAETIFERIEKLGGSLVFDDKAFYLRAFNLEKAKNYLRAAALYSQLIKIYPNSPHVQEATFKSGLLYVYILRDIPKGWGFFEQLAERKDITSYVISSLYHLGLISQWQEDFVQAKQYYEKLIELAADDFGDTVKLAKKRLEEIKTNEPMEHNLRTFLDVSLKDEHSIFDTSRIELKSHPYEPQLDKPVNVSSQVNMEQSGCMQVEVRYLWSGHIGQAEPESNQSEFTTTYLFKGTKEINLVVVSSSGIVDRGFDIIDVR